MSALGWLSIYCAAMVGVSLVGGWIPLLVRLTHRRMQVALSFVSGVMLGVGLMHLLPHAIYEGQAAAGSLERAMPVVLSWLLAGLLTMFFIERFFCFHHHDAPHHDAPHTDVVHSDCGHSEPEDFGHVDHEHAHQLRWSGAAVGLVMHSAIEGVALAAAVTAEAGPGRLAPLVGLSTFLVIFLHKPFDSLTLGTLMAAGGRSTRSRHLINALFAAIVPLGAGLFYLSTRHADASGNATLGNWYLAAALAFSAGTFLCISLSDLLPELYFHHHDRLLLSAALLLGLGVAWLASLMESGGHSHSRIAPPAIVAPANSP
ncbi:MAG: ZIP family metal transporter [Planctomycetia bacterium]|nr:ZIP family metal transporter [Planctomycetia bacterium]